MITFDRGIFVIVCNCKWIILLVTHERKLNSALHSDAIYKIDILNQCEMYPKRCVLEFGILNNNLAHQSNICILLVLAKTGKKYDDS